MIIGKHWTFDVEARRNRLFDHEDWVRLELEVALDKEKTIFPVTVDRDFDIKGRELPTSIHRILKYHAIKVDSGLDFKYHIKRLIKAVESKKRALPSDTLKGENHVVDDVEVDSDFIENQIKINTIIPMFAVKKGDIQPPAISFLVFLLLIVFSPFLYDYIGQSVAIFVISSIAFFGWTVARLIFVATQQAIISSTSHEGDTHN